MLIKFLWIFFDFWILWSLGISGGETGEETGTVDCEGDDLEEASMISKNMVVKRKIVTIVKGKEFAIVVTEK